MKPKSAPALAGVLTIAWMCVSLPCLAQSSTPAAASAPPAAVGSTPAAAPPAETGPTQAGEPNVKYTLIEDEGSKIEELKVRGNTQRITVTPKVGVHKSYEIITGDGSHDLTQGANTSRGLVGQRVWNVFQF